MNGCDCLVSNRVGRRNIHCICKVVIGLSDTHCIVNVESKIGFRFKPFDKVVCIIGELNVGNTCTSLVGVKSLVDNVTDRIVVYRWKLSRTRVWR